MFAIPLLTIKQKSSFIAFLAIGSTLINLSILSSIHTPIVNPKIQESNFINEASPLVNSNNKKFLNSLANIQFKYDDSNPILLKTEMTQNLLSNNNYFLALMTFSEGFTPKIYKDNKGFALGVGWNLSKQSFEFNEKLAQAIFKNTETINTISSITGNSHEDIDLNESKINSIKITPIKSLQIGQLIKENIELKSLEKIINYHLVKLKISSPESKSKKIISNLKINEKEAILYHIYKVGTNGSMKYKKLFTNLITYSNFPTLQNKKLVISQINYQYKQNGKIKDDIQAKELVTAMFSSPEDFSNKINLPKTLIASNLKLDSNLVKIKI